MAGVEGLEPPTYGFGDRCSSQLSYTPIPREYSNAILERANNRLMPAPNATAPERRRNVDRTFIAVSR